MLQEELIIQELGSSKILVYKGDVENLNFHLNLPNILTFVRTTFVDVPLCYFDVSGKATLSEVQRYTLDKYDVLKMLKMTLAVAEACETENIDRSNILFNNDYVFVDSEFNTFFIPLNIEDKNNVDLHTFLKNLVINSIIDTRYTDNFVQQLLNCFNEPKFTIGKLLTLVNQLLATKPYSLSYNIGTNPEGENSEGDTANYTDTIIVDMLKKQLDNKTNKPFQGEDKEKQKEILETLTLKDEKPNFEKEEEEDSKTTPKTPVNSGFMPNLGASSYVNKSQPESEPVITSRPLNDLPPLNYEDGDDYSEKIDDDMSGDDDYYEISQIEKDIQHPFYNDMQPDKYEGDYGEEYTRDPIPVEESGYETRAYLISSEDSDTRISIDFNPFRIGRNPDLVDYVINSPYVGRLHATIQSDDENDYYVVDKSSTNGTFLNGQRLNPEEAVPLISGSVVRFAKHSFQFIIE